MKDLFIKNRNPYNLRHNSQFSRPVIKSVYNGTEGISSLRQKIWDLVPSTIKEVNQLETFKQKMETCKLSLPTLWNTPPKYWLFIEKTLNLKKKNQEIWWKFCLMFCLYFLFSTVPVVFYITDQEHKRYEWGSVFSPVMPGGNGRDIFIVNWNFLTKFFSFDPTFHRNILASLYLKSVTSVRAYLRDYSFTHTLCKFHDMVSVANLHWGYLLITGAHIYCHKCGYVTLPRNTIRCATSY